jgi:hypothetical protein
MTTRKGKARQTRRRNSAALSLQDKQYAPKKIDSGKAYNRKQQREIKDDGE